MKGKGFFGKLWQGIKRLFSKKQIKHAVHVGIEVVECIKHCIESPVVPLFTSLIPGTVDEAIVAQLRYWLPKILVEMRLADEALRTAGADAIVQFAVRHLKELPVAEREKRYLSIAAKVSQALSSDGDGGKQITYEEWKGIVETIYQNHYKN